MNHHHMHNMSSGGMSGHETTTMDHSMHKMTTHGTGYTHDMHAGHGDMHAGHDPMNNMHNSHGGMGMNMSHGMKMYFHTGVMEYVLFEDCHTTTVGGLIGACFAVFVAAILYEGLKFFREVLLQKTLKDKSRSIYTDKDHRSKIGDDEIDCGIIGSRMFSCGHFVQTLLHVIQVFISYCLMLVFMTYNVWLCIAVVLGAGVGYFIFGWKRAVVVDVNEHCH